jgi:hypothetical protein
MSDDTGHRNVTDPDLRRLLAPLEMDAGGPKWTTPVTRFLSGWAEQCEVWAEGQEKAGHHAEADLTRSHARAFKRLADDVTILSNRPDPSRFRRAVEEAA